jgi:hypothetical protein
VKRFKDLAIALSLANLLFLEVWVGIVPGSLWHYHLSKPPPPALFIAVVVNILLLAFVFWAVVLLARRSGSIVFRAIVRWAFLFVFVIPIHTVRQQIPGLSDSALRAALGKIPLSIIAYTLGATAIILFWKWTDRFVHTMATILLLLAPFVIFTFFQAGWAVLAPRSAFSDFAESSAPLLKTARISPRPRVVWLIFDELDQRMTFVNRPDSVKMPEIDRLRSHAVYASNAYPPAGKTLVSIPALITGRFVSKATISNSKELLISFNDAAQPVRLSSQANIFSRARGMGLNSAAVGWYHPYCRLIGSSLASCDIHGSRWDMPELTMSEMLRYPMNPAWMPVVWKNLPLLKKLGIKGHFERFHGSKRRAVVITRYLNMLADAKAVLANPALDLVFVHWTIPHPAGIYNRAKKQLAWDGARQTYLDNLELVDNTIGELRRFMESAGTWQASTVIVSSDHAYRTYLWTSLAKEEKKAVGGKFDGRIPFLIKLPGQQRPLVYEPALNTVVTHDLILALLEPTIKDPEALVEWLDKHRSADPPTDEDESPAAAHDPANATEWQ